MSPLPVQLMCGWATDRGLRREINEDSLVAAGPLFAVADGMGGHEAGEVASGICVEVLEQDAVLTGAAATADDLSAAIAAADNRIREVGESRAGTTLSGVLLLQEEEPAWLVFNIGDSRTYRLKEGALEQISVDHSAVQELVNLGQLSPQEARMHPRRNVVTRALGTGPRVTADTWLLPAAPGDRMLVCSDGLTNEVDDDEVKRILGTVDSPQDAAAALLQAALRTGGRDNITVIVVDAAAAPELAAAVTAEGEPEGPP